MLEIEKAEPVRNHCDCCGGTTTVLTRYVTEDGNAYAVYYAALHDAAPGQVKAVVSIGPWWSGTTPEQRTAFALLLWSKETEYAVTVEDAETSPWSNVGLLGRMLDREEALQHPRLADVFHITDHILRDDSEVREFLGRERPG